MSASRKADVSVEEEKCIQVEKSIEISATCVVRLDSMVTITQWRSIFIRDDSVWNLFIHAWVRTARFNFDESITDDMANVKNFQWNEASLSLMNPLVFFSSKILLSRILPLELVEKTWSKILKMIKKQRQKCFWNRKARKECNSW